MFIASQIFGLLGFITVIIAMTLKGRRELLFYKLVSTIFILCGYFFVNSTAGILIAVVSLMRGCFALGFTYNNNLKLKKLSMILLCFLAVLLNIVFWQNGLNILAIAISLISIFCFFQSKVFLIRMFSILVSVLEIILNIIILSPMNIAIEIFTITSCVVGIMQHDVMAFKTKRQPKVIKL